MSDERPIGIFDSGLGGLTVVREVMRLMPGERVAYLGDTARCPYGGRSESAIRQFGLQDAHFLISQDIKLLVVACNTVSSVALEDIRQVARDIPVIGVVSPGARAAVLRTAERKIGVIGTVATIRTQSYTRAMHEIDARITVFGKACPLFVPLVEEGLFNSDISRLAAQHYLYDIVNSDIDCLILGCTHYPLLMEVIQSTVGNRIQLIDSALWTAKEAQDILVALNAQCAAPKGGLERSRFFVSDCTPDFERLAAMFLGTPLPLVERVGLEQLASMYQLTP